ATFDGVPLDVNVAFPAETGSDTDWPVVGIFHGYGGSKVTFASMQRWLDKGYAVYSITNRGSGESCKSAGSISAGGAACDEGWVHLMDPRFEIRDTQNFLGELVDEGVISPTRIAATGGSYGGAQSLHLAILKNRVVNPDGSYSPWTSPLGENMSIAVATPSVPWSDLMQALAPNGDTLDYLEDGKFRGNVGVMKESFVQGLYASARNAPAGVDPKADLAGWFNRLNQGEPYTDAASQAMVDEIIGHHSPYYDDHSQAPAPLLLSPGFTDDLFPVDEVLRFYNRTRAEHPGAKISVFAGSFGHARGQSQGNVSSALSNLEEDWIDFYLDDAGSEPISNVVAYTQTCPNGTAGGGPFTAPQWADLAPGELVLTDTGEAKTIAAGSGTDAVSSAFNPLTGGVTACSTASDAIEPGSATYDMAAAPAGGFTVLGSATVIAKITSANGPDSQIAARLVDLDGAGNKTLISRATWRPDASGYQVFQLHPGAWEVEAGHVVRLELLGKDAAGGAGGFLTNYARPSNSPNAITIENLELRVPVVETPGSLDGMVKAPATKVLPDVAGAELAPGYGAIGSESVVDYGARVDPCPDGTTGTYPPDCVTDTCPTGQVGTPPDCVDEPLFGKLANPVIKAPKKVKSGKKMTIKIKARNKGATNLTSVRVCLKTQKKFVKGKVKRCRVFSNLAAGKTKTAKYKVKTKGGKAGKKTKVQAVVTSAGQVKRTKATVRLKR
ncbi:MAG: alpha/beta fold hydrolase, partial [Solirubrobacterales bacterium]